MTFEYPIMLVVAVVVGGLLWYAYRRLQRQRTQTLIAAGLTSAVRGRAAWRRNLPPVLFLLALVVLLGSTSRPQATVSLPRASGTIILAFDVSNSMGAQDVAPSRLGAAQAAATEFVNQQPDTVDIGVVAFDQGALTTKSPTKDHDEAIAAINRLHISGGTSLGQAILASLTAITGRTVSLPDPNGNETAQDLGYWSSATIVLLSDGEDTGGPDAVAAAELAANAGVHIETIGFGTVEGTTIEVDGYQVGTALNEDELTLIAQTTAATYHRAGDAQSLNDIYRSLDLRITAKPEEMEVTGFAVGLGILFLTAGGFMMINWFGRIL